MLKRLARIYGILLVILVIAGLSMERGHFLKLMNVNITLDILRIALAILLLYAGFRSRNASFVRSVISATGILYIGIGLLGLINGTLWGLLPDGLTFFDVLFHLGLGVIALRAAYLRPTPT